MFPFEPHDPSKTLCHNCGSVLKPGKTQCPDCGVRICGHVYPGATKTLCQRDPDHKGSHSTRDGRFAWPNDADPEPQGFFVHLCPPGQKCPHCGSEPGRNNP